MSASTRSSAPGVDDRALQRGDLPVVEVGVADQLVDDPARRRRERLARIRDEHGALALAQVVARRLAGLALVAEDAEDVIPQLERHPERMPERVERRRLGEIGARERRRRSRAAAARCSGRT